MSVHCVHSAGQRVLSICPSFPIAALGQFLMHMPQPMHFDGYSVISRLYDWDSGLAHQGHLSGHPLKNTSVRSPSPSWIEHFCILNIIDISPLQVFCFVFILLSFLSISKYHATFSPGNKIKNPLYAAYGISVLSFEISRFLRLAESSCKFQPAGH